MRGSLGQPVIIDNVTGAAGSIAVGRVARAAPDGYTLILGNLGTHVVNGAIYPLPYDVVKDSLTIGRGGIAYPVDVRVAASPDVSREHARIRRDPKTGRFFVIDLSSLGTTLNGRHVPKGYDDVDGARRENGAETPLPDSARIGLADTVFLEFERVS